MDYMELAGKVAIVTGAAKGIGRAIATRLVEHGVRVIIGDIDIENAKSTAQELSRRGSCSAYFMNLSNIDSIKSFTTKVLQDLGTVDILINNAGVASKEELFELSSDTWDFVMNINLKGPFFLAQQVAATMSDKRAGRIVNMASTSSFVASSQCMIPYDVSKAGLKMLTAAMAVQLAPYGVTVNAVAPGSTNTTLLQGLFDVGGLQNSTTAIPLGRLAVPEDIAGAVLYLCSDQASFVTGHTLVVDGGYMLK